MSKLNELLTEIETKAAEVAGLFDDADDKHNGEMPDDARERVKTLNKEIETLENRAVDLKGDDAIRVANERRRSEFKTPVSRPPFPGAPAGDPGKGGVQIPRSIGEFFANEAKFKNWIDLVAPHGHFGEKMSLTSPAVTIPGLGVKTLITGLSDTSGGAMIANDVQAGIQMLGRRPLTIRDIITVGTTTSDVVEFVRETSQTNNAAPVAEATAASGSTGAKPESALALEKVTTAVKTIAHWIPATTRAIADAGQLKTLIDSFLRQGLEEELEDQIVAGSGVGENFTGIANVSGKQSQAWDTNALTTLRRARTLVRTVGRAVPTAYLLHPNDWEDIDLLQDNEGRYYFGGPSVLGMPRLWGLPVVESEGVTEGYGFVADFRTVVLWDREQASIQVSNSHSDFFTRNLIAILSELRAALGIFRPAAIVQADLTA